MIVKSMFTNAYFSSGTQRFLDTSIVLPFFTEGVSDFDVFEIIDNLYGFGSNGLIREKTDEYIRNLSEFQENFYSEVDAKNIITTYAVKKEILAGIKPISRGIDYCKKNNLDDGVRLLEVHRDVTSKIVLHVPIVKSSKNGIDPEILSLVDTIISKSNARAKKGRLEFSPSKADIKTFLMAYRCNAKTIVTNDTGFWILNELLGDHLGGKIPICNPNKVG